MLPITSYKNEIIEAVRNHAFTIVSAETGSGKSTQIPQYLAEYYSQIIVTEPRIIAAKTLAKRVAEEMNITLGEKVGYRTANDSCSSADTNILYCSDGLQLIRTIFSKDNEAENVLVIDEIHDWNLNIETLIAWCKFMKDKWNTKVVLMSATIDTDGLADFLGKDVAVLNIPGTLFDVEVEERDESELIDSIKENINLHKNILVFAPGKKEISDIIYELRDEAAVVLPLHGEMEWEEQKKCFERYFYSKVIVATNVAQTSLTIPDIDVVIDTGNARISIAKDGIQGLFLSEISVADIMQRKGRAGRTKEGKYILCSDTQIADRDEFSVPEIQRSILDRVVLQLASIGLDAENLEFYHQPDLQAISKAKVELTNIGALYKNRVTELGRKMVKIPVSVQFARMIVEAEKYGVTEQVMTIAAILEMGGLLEKRTSYSKFTMENSSDLLAELDVWNKINQTRIDFEELGIKKKNFFKIKEHIKKLRQTLSGIVELKDNDDRNAVLKACLSGLVSHIYYGVSWSGKLYDRDGNCTQLDNNSCICGVKLVIGIPKTIEYQRYGDKYTLNLVSFASRIDVDTLIELAPNAIKEERSLRYSPNHDAVEITTVRSFAGSEVDKCIIYDRNHPEYAKLKAKYSEGRYDYYIPVGEQRTVVIDGKEYEVSYYNDYGCYAVVVIDNKTLFSTNTEEVFLDSGKEVVFESLEEPRAGRSANLRRLRGYVMDARKSRVILEKYSEYASLRANTLQRVLDNADKIGKVEIIVDDIEKLVVYACLELKYDNVSFSLVADEECANMSTLEALKYLFMKEIDAKYCDSKFSHVRGKKRRILTEDERNAKEDFDSLVRESLLNLTIENVSESMEFLEEYYQELMAA